MKNSIILLSLFIFSFVMAPQVTYAAAKKSSFPIGVSAKASKDKTSITATFSNLKGVTSISYILSYDTNGKSEGAVGTIKPKNSKPISRKLLLGTCSSGVCRYHKNITKATLEVTVKTKKGSSSKTFPIKI